MVTERLGIRIDRERRRKLEQMATEEDESVSEVIRTLIDEGYEARMRARRKAAVEQIINANVEDVPDPEELSRQLAQTYDIGDLH